jgi:hypothetical protein
VPNNPYFYDADGNFLGLQDSKGKWIRQITFLSGTAYCMRVCGAG